jgi:hypothetical protein
MSKPTPVKTVTVTIGGAAHVGTYYVQNSIVYVHSSFGAKATQVEKSLPETIAAKKLLAELVRAGSSTD